MSRRHCRWVCVTLTAALAFHPGQSPSQSADQIRRVGDYYAKADSFSGNVVFVRDGSVVSNESYGLANIEQGVRNTAQTRFAIGSVSKQFTAAAILLLQEEGLLKTADTLAMHYSHTPAAWNAVTLRQLLQHTSGIPDGVMVWGAAGKELGEPTPEQVVAATASKPLVFQPGSRMEYNNMGYVLLGLVVEQTSGQPLREFLQKRFFTPLGMLDTGLASSREVIPRLAAGYAPNGGGLEVANPVTFTSAFAAGAIYSTGADLAKWLTALHGGRVLKPASYAEMTIADGDGYGYGLRVTNQGGQTDIGHNGRVSGFATETEYFPKEKTGIILLSNKLSHNISPGEAALDSDLMHLVTDPNAAVRSLRNEKHVNPILLQRYVGTYSADEGNAPKIDVTFTNGQLRLLPKGKDASTLIPRSDHEFYMKEWEGEAEFVPAAKDTWTLHIFTLPNQTMLSMTQAHP